MVISAVLAALLLLYCGSFRPTRAQLDPPTRMLGERLNSVFGGLLPLAHLLLVLPAGGSTSPFIGEGSRFILSLAEDRPAYLRAIQDDGYKCWLAPTSFAGAVCIQNHDPPNIAPDTPAGLRRILGRVNLRKWLPDVLCRGEGGTRPPDTDAVNEIDVDSETIICRGIVDASLTDTPPVTAWASGPDVDMSVRSAVEDIPWVNVMEACTEKTWVKGLHPFQCTTMVTMLASDRGKEQLLPALRKISRTATAAPPGGKHSSPSPKVIAELLAVLETDPTMSSLRIGLPRPRGRTSGSAVAFLAEVSLGTTPEAKLTDGHPSIRRCEVRVVVDGVVAKRIFLDSAQTSQSLAVGVTPAYGSRCSEHPAHATMAAAAAAAAAKGAAPVWTHNKNMWYMEAREVDRVCTNDTFGPHRIHAELACCDGGEGGGANRVEHDAAGPGEPASSCEVLASAAPVEYIHTANGAPVLSAWSEERQETGPSPLLLPPPDNISVSLHLERMPNTVNGVVTVPRWSSDGEVWEAAVDVCSKAFGPEQAVLVELNDCVDLVTSAVRDKRVDMYHRMVLRLEAYLNSADPSLVRGEFEGHTGAVPEKAAALGAVSREGGERVGTVCEVGFNAGHSSLNWLLNTRPSTRVVAFDLGSHAYVGHAIDFLQAVFPGRIEVVLGDSSGTVPAYSRRKAAEGLDPRACNVVFVDGDHSEDAVYADFVNFQHLSSRSWHALVIDDIDTRGVSAAWRRFKEEGRGRLERMVQATAEHYTQVEETEGMGGSQWGAVFENKMDWVFMQQGYFSMGIGSYRLPLGVTE